MNQENPINRACPATEGVQTIKAHGREIRVETREGEGSVFTIMLPV